MSAVEVVPADERVQVIEEDSNVYIDIFSPVLAIWSSTTISLAADDTIPSGYNIIFLSGDGGHVTLTNTPTIAAGTKGQLLFLVGTDDSATVTVQDNTNLPGSTLCLEYSRDVTLGNNDVLALISTGSAWIRLGGSDNA